MHHHSHPWGESEHHRPGGRRGLFSRDEVILIILDLLREQPRHGYDVILELEDRSRGFYSPSPGVVYPSFQSLEDRDFVTATAEAGGKKVYSITEAGLAWLHDREEDVARVREKMFSFSENPGLDEWPGAIHELKAFLADVVTAMRKSGRDPEKIRQIREIVAESRKKIDDIVAR